MRRKYILILSCLFLTFNVFSQDHEAKEPQRILNLERQLDSLKTYVSGLSKTIDFNVSNIELPSFVRSIGRARKVNISVAPSLETVVLTHNFSNASIKDVILYLCKEHKLTFDITGNIISLKKYIPESEKNKFYKSRDIPITYVKENDLFSIDLQNDSLSVAFKKITNVTGNNLVFSPGLAGKKVSVYIQNKPFESAMDKLAFSNNLLVTKTQDNYYLFENATETVSPSSRNIKGKQNQQRPKRYRSSNFYFKILDKENKLLEVDFQNVPIGSIIKDISNELKVNMFTNAPLNNIGTASVKADRISYDELLVEILQDAPFTFKKKNEMYFFGKNEQPSIRSSVVIPLMYRSIEIMNEPILNRNNLNWDYNNRNNNTINGYNSRNRDLGVNQQNNYNNQRNINTRNNQYFSNYTTKSEALVDILPEEVKKDLEVKTDVEHNTFIVTGEAQKIERFKEFIAKIDKAVPVVLIEVMILEINNSATVSTGLDLGLGNNPTNDGGGIFPNADLTLGANTINKVIGGFNGFGSLNLGRVVPNFFAKIQLLESNGDVKIKSTPKLSTLNGHQAMLSSGERSYYKVQETNVIGIQNPQTIQTNNYYPIDADLSIGIRPIVSGDEQITLNINVSQSSFNGKQIESGAPPGVNSREFTSTIRVRDQDVIILGGLEENIKNDSGSGVPFLARVPIIKWFFSKRTRTASKSKLSVLIRPTIIR